MENTSLRHVLYAWSNAFGVAFVQGSVSACSTSSLVTSETPKSGTFLCPLLSVYTLLHGYLDYFQTRVTLILFLCMEGFVALLKQLTVDLERKRL